MKYAVYAAYGMIKYEQKEIISVHSSYDLARKGCRKVNESFTAIAEVRDDAKKGQNLESVRIID